MLWHTAGLFFCSHIWAYVNQLRLGKLSVAIPALKFNGGLSKLCSTSMIKKGPKRRYVGEREILIKIYQFVNLFVYFTCQISSNCLRWMIFKSRSIAEEIICYNDSSKCKTYFRRSHTANKRLNVMNPNLITTETCYCNYVIHHSPLSPESLLECIMPCSLIYD